MIITYRIIKKKKHANYTLQKYFLLSCVDLVLTSSFTCHFGWSTAKLHQSACQNFTVTIHFFLQKCYCLLHDTCRFIIRLIKFGPPFCFRHVRPSVCLESLYCYIKNFVCMLAANYHTENCKSL